MESRSGLDFSALDALLQGLVPPYPPYHLEPLTGDASSRRYYRIRAQHGASTRTGVGATSRLQSTGEAESLPPSLILMAFDPDGPLSSEEKTSSGEVPPEVLFINVQRYLSSLGLPVPRVLAYARPHGLVVLEDFGDLTLEAWQRNRDPIERLTIYQQAVEVLVEFQSRGSAHLDSSCWAAHEVFDEALLRWEFDHFYQYAVEARHGAPSAAARATIDAAFSWLTDALARLPRTLVHRDYHARNLMVFEGQIKLIDFQDALLGPRHYDLASLLRDAYVQLPEDDVDRLIAHYLEICRQRGSAGPDLAPETFRLDFDRVSLHRCMKAAGRFEYLHFVKGNSRLLPSVPGALAHVRRILCRYTELAPLREALGERIPALRDS